MVNFRLSKILALAAFCLFSLGAAAQTLQNGVVKDAAGQPLADAAVIVDGMQGVKTYSDQNGRFSLRIPEGAKSITVSFMGFAPRQFNIDPNASLDVVLEKNDNVLDDLVVVGYGTQKKVNLTGAVGAADSKTLESRPVSSVGAALQGAIGNLNITTGGRANDASKFNVRGFGSINGTASPLILIDNVTASEEELARMNPMDIESVSVLKDAASAAIYGARAAFGVVLITTKRGTSETLKINVSFNQSYAKATRLPKYSYDPYTIVTYKDIMGAPWYDMHTDADKQYALERRNNPNGTPAVIVDPNNPDGWRYFGTTNWNDIVFGTAPTTNVNFNISQRKGKTSVYLSGDFISQDGAIKIGNENYKRYNVRSKVDYDLLKWVKLTSNISYVYDNYDAPYYAKSEGSYFSTSSTSLFYEVNKTNVLFTPYNPDETLRDALLNSDITTKEFNKILSSPNNPNGTLPYSYYGASIIGGLRDGGRMEKRNSDVMASFGTEITLIKNMWSLKADATFKRRSMAEKNYDWSRYFGAGPQTTNVPLDGGISAFVQEHHAPARYNAFNIYTNFDKSFGQHTLSALVGFNQEESIYDYWYVRRDGLASNAVPSLHLATGQITTDASAEDWAIRGAFTRLNYNYDNKYIVEVNGRYDGTSRFPKADRFAFFPSVSAGWLLSEESFFEPVRPIVNLLKVRGSVGMLGNQNVSAYAFREILRTYFPEQVVDGKKPLAFGPGDLVSANLTWEKVITKNVGVDLSLFKNRVSASFDLFRRDTKDMLCPSRTLPGVLGTTAPKINGANLKTNGWELYLSYRDTHNVGGKPLSYGITFSLADSRSYITKYDNPLGNLDDYYKGQEIGQIWGLHTDGFFKDAADIASIDQTEVTGYLGVRPIEPGDIKFKDLDGDGKISRGDWTLADHGDYRVIGNTTPRMPYSINLNASWYGFDVRVFLQGVGKMDYYPPAGHLTFWGIYSEPWVNVLASNTDHWTPENPNGYFPRLKSYTAESNTKDLGIPQTKYLQDASYLRLKNLTIGYTLPKSLTQKIKIDNVRFYVSGENLALWTKLSENLDPENLTTAYYPIQKIFSFGINLNF